MQCGCCTKRRQWLICFVLFLALASPIIFVCFVLAPVKVKATVEDARLDSFSFTTAQSRAAMVPSLTYNVSVALTIHNRNAAFIKYTKPLVATFVFHDRRLYSTTAMGKGVTQRPLRTKLRLLYAGGVAPPYILDNATIQDFKQQNVTGLFKLELRLSGEIAFLWLERMHRKWLGISCPLSLQLAPPGPEVLVFRKVSCKLGEPEKIYF